MAWRDGKRLPEDGACDSDYILALRRDAELRTWLRIERALGAVAVCGLAESALEHLA